MKLYIRTPPRRPTQLVRPSLVTIPRTMYSNPMPRKGVYEIKIKHGKIEWERIFWFYEDYYSRKVPKK